MRSTGFEPVTVRSGGGSSVHLSYKRVVPSGGVEPPTSGSVDRRSVLLSYEGQVAAAGTSPRRPSSCWCRLSYPTAAMNASSRTPAVSALATPAGFEPASS